MNKTQSKIQTTNLSLPKGGGAIQGMGETFQPNDFSGTAGLSIPIAASPCRDFAPQLQLTYNSGAGNSPWGMGFSLSLPRITRQTRKGTPRYQGTDTFVLSGAEDLVPLDNASRNENLNEVTYTVQTYAPRKEGLFALIEHWYPQGQIESPDAFWKVTSKDHTISIFGKTEQAKIVDPSNTGHTFTWLLEESYNPKGDHQLFFYKKEDSANLSNDIYEQSRTKSANRYIQTIRYGNTQPLADAMLLTNSSAVSEPTQWHFELVFDYSGENLPTLDDTLYEAIQAQNESWSARPDAFSDYHAGFEIRTHRRCYHTLLFHRFQDEFGENPVLVHATQYDYQTNYAQLSECKSITQTGYTYNKEHNTYAQASLPSLDLDYLAFQPQGHSFVPLTSDQSQSLQGLNQPPNYTLVDLYGEGIPGILYSDGATTYYREPALPLQADSPAEISLPSSSKRDPRVVKPTSMTYATWQQLDTFPLPRQVQGTPDIMLQDLTGNGQLDIVMGQNNGLHGCWEAQPDRTWKSFRTLEAWPADFPPPSHTWVDVTGDGIADLLQLTAQEIRIYPNAREQGLEAPIIRTPAPDMPTSLAGSPTETIQFADMAGSGQAHLVRIRNGAVTYWPNLGYGHFGDPIQMDNSPQFGTEFNASRLFLADLDGSGTTDLVYLTKNKATCYFNQSGNALSDPVTIPLPFAFDHLDQVSFADVYGRGNTCLIISQPHTQPNPQHWCYDFCQQQKPYLLQTMKNNMGARTTLTYGSSVDFYLADKKAGTPWITPLPFPVHVITQITHEDEISQSRYASQYAYHHGYYDGVEREFRGFGRVDRQDAEYFPTTTQDKDATYVAPSLSRTWYHTGAYLEETSLSAQYAKEYYQGDDQAFSMPASVIDWKDTTPDGETQRQAAVALAGATLRSELYGLDDDKQATAPYSVESSNFNVILKQPKGTNPYAIFYTHNRQSLSYTYERDSADPQIHQSFVLQVDDHGHVERSCAIAYPRRAGEGVLAEQQKLHVTATQQTYVNQTEPDSYLLGVPIENKNFEITGLQPPESAAFTFDDIKGAIDTALSSITESSPTSDQANLLGWQRFFYAQTADTTSTVLPFGEIALPLLLAEQHVAEFTQDQINTAFGETPLTGDGLTSQLKEGYYALDTTSQMWWNPGLTEVYNSLDQFYLPQATLDPAGHATQYSYDPYGLLVNYVTDALGNTTKAQAIDYQHLHPTQMLDMNGNSSEVKLDPLGRVIHTSLYGTEAGEEQGFAPISQAPTDIPNGLQEILDNPQQYLGDMQTYFYYDPFAWQDRQEPVYSLTLIAQQYPTNPQEQTADNIQIHLTYNDGFGRTLCEKNKVESGKAFLYDATTDTVSSVAEDLPQDQTRWLTSGRVVYNNKGKQVKQYEPYYINTPHFVSTPLLDTFGVSATLYYDPLERLTQTLMPNGFWSKHSWTAWTQTLSDANDTFLDSLYCQVNITSPDTSSPFYDSNLTDKDRAVLKAAINSESSPDQPTSGLGLALLNVIQHMANTPQRIIVDNLGHTIIEQKINRSATDPDGTTLQTHHTYDIQGHLLTSTDPRLTEAGQTNFAMTYSLVGDTLKTISVDAGTHWQLNNIFGNPIWSYNQRKITRTTTYDALHRPSQVQVQKPKHEKDPLELDQVVAYFIYGDTPEALNQPEDYNLRGQLYQHYDQAGLVTTPSYSLLSKPLSTQRQFAKAYTTEVNWGQQTFDKTKTPLAATPYKEQFQYDALGRIIQNTDADNNQTNPTYYLSGRLSQVKLTPKDDPTPIDVVQTITYNAKNQREAITYGNHTTTTYTYDPKTWQTIGIQTQNNEGKHLQELHYTYDPVNNIVQKTDKAQDTLFNNNQQVEPTATYTYDALYQLIAATGREKQGSNETTAGHDIPTMDPGKNNNQALQNYVEKYTYDTAGNLTQTQHTANKNSWTRHMVVSNTSNRAVTATINGTQEQAPTPEQVNSYFDSHGNQTKTGQLYPLAWNYRDNLAQATLIKRNNGQDDTEYYIYDSQGQRVRKVSQQYGQEGQHVTLKETLYLGSLEYRRTLQGPDATRVQVTNEYHALRIMDDKKCVATRNYWKIGAPPKDFKNPVMSYHLDDALGSCTIEVDGQGKQITREEYTPYGDSALFIGTGSASQLKHYRYSGKERDSITGFYYYGARYYAPWLGRWLSPDPAGTIDGPNLYAFVGGNPVTHVDVGGMMMKNQRDFVIKTKGKFIMNRRAHTQERPKIERNLVIFGGAGDQKNVVDGAKSDATVTSFQELSTNKLNAHDKGKFSGHIIIFAHGNNQGLAIKKEIYRGKEVATKLGAILKDNEIGPEKVKKIDFYSCNVGKKSFVDNFAKHYKSFSEENKVIIRAPKGQVSFNPGDVIRVGKKIKGKFKAYWRGGTKPVEYLTTGNLGERTTGVGSKKVKLETGWKIKTLGGKKSEKGSEPPMLRIRTGVNTRMRLNRSIG